MKRYKIIHLIVLLVLFVSCKNEHYKKGKELFDKGNYEYAKTKFQAVSNDDEHYDEAQKLLKITDSILKIRIRKEFVKDSIAKVKKKIKLDSIKKAEKVLADKNEIERLKKEIKSIKKFNGNEYRNEISSLVIEVALFSTWGRMADTAKNSDNKTIRKQGKNIEYHLKRLQIKEFPRIRANYGKILKNKLWEQDITVSVFGKRKTTLQFTGGTFAANKNKQDFQSTLSKTFNDFRFKRVNYKWYKYDDTYTYYTLDSDKDSKIKLY